MKNMLSKRMETAVVTFRMSGSLLIYAKCILREYKVLISLGFNSITFSLMALSGVLWHSLTKTMKKMLRFIVHIEMAQLWFHWSKTWIDQIVMVYCLRLEGRQVPSRLVALQKQNHLVSLLLHISTVFIHQMKPFLWIKCQNYVQKG